MLQALLPLMVSENANAGPAGCGGGGQPACGCHAMSVVVVRQAAPPGDTREMEVQVTLIDSFPAFPCTCEIELAQMGGPATALGIGTADPFPLEIVPDSGGEGYGVATVPVEVPVGADATDTLSHDGVYELQATITGIQPAAPYDSDVVSYCS